ncbi:MAG: LysR family transcriptional regulator [Neisseriaceae bacterium]|nr:LysR family transcriptional regulator [Neisseriaceae bacterium]MBP6863333.1 LysR family transcriptional regulator [Neisseriaceae bacterium]
MNTTLEEYLAFQTVVDCGSITAAAEQLGLTVSGVSRALTRLEHKLDTPLLTRTTRRLDLTDEGRYVLAAGRDILHAVDRLEEQMAIRRQQPSGRLRINGAPSFISQVIVPLVGAFRQAYPHISLELDSNDFYIDLLAQHTDIAIRIGHLSDSTLHARLLGHSQSRIFASPAYLAAHGTPTTVAELAQHTLLGFNKIPTLNQWPLLDDKGVPLQVEPNLLASSGATLLALGLADQGIFCLTDFTTRAARSQGQLVELFAAERLPHSQPVNAVYYRNTQLSSRITAFLDFIQASVRAYL